MILLAFGTVYYVMLDLQTDRDALALQKKFEIDTQMSENSQSPKYRSKSDPETSPNLHSEMCLPIRRISTKALSESENI